MLFRHSSLPVLLAAVGGVLGAASHARLGARGEKPGLPFDPSTARACDYWYDNETGSLACSDIPDIFGLSLADFRALASLISTCFPSSGRPRSADKTHRQQNPIITATCGGFTKGKAYCVQGEPDAKTPQPSSTTPTTKTTTTTTKPTTSTTKPSTTTPKPSTTTAPQPTTTQPAGNGIETPSAVQPGMVSNCDAFVLVKPGDTCASLAKAAGITPSQFAAWNTGVGGEACRGMWADVYACVSVIGHTPTPVSPGNGVTTPEPVQAGMTTRCKAFHLMKANETCTDLAVRYGMTVEQIKAWNPAAGERCIGLWADAWVCVGVL